MLKIRTSLLIVFSLFFAATAFAAPKHFNGGGEVVSVDAFYGRLTIKHGAIKGFSGDGETEFTASDPKILKQINTRDLVDFSVVDNSGDVTIDSITKTGQAPPEEETKLGKVVQDVLVGTGEVAKGVTSPLPPAHEAMSGAVDATTGATGSVLKNADNKVKEKF